MGWYCPECHCHHPESWLYRWGGCRIAFAWWFASLDVDEGNPLAWEHSVSQAVQDHRDRNRPMHRVVRGCGCIGYTTTPCLECQQSEESELQTKGYA